MISKAQGTTLKDHNANVLAMEIEKLVERDELTYMEALVHISETKHIDAETISKILSPVIRDKLKYEAVERNMLKVKRNKPKTRLFKK